MKSQKLFLLLSFFFLSNFPPVFSQVRSLSQLQLDLMNLRFGMFIHFSPTTYLDVADQLMPDHAPSRQGKDGIPGTKDDLSLNLFNPAKLDCNQWANAAKSAGMKFGVLTAKHHDGFCLWPSKYSDYTVAQGCKKDVVKEFVEAFREKGLKVGLYYSIRDRTAEIGNMEGGGVNSAKIELIKNQLTELLTNYGPILYIVFDAWGNTWHESPTFEDIPYNEIYYHIKTIQPECLVLNHSTRREVNDVLQIELAAKVKMPEGVNWPAVGGNTLQDSWFWRRNYTSGKLKSVKWIVEDQLIPFNNRNAVFQLNCAPNRDGLMDDNVLKVLAEVGKIWKAPDPIKKIPDEWLDWPVPVMTSQVYASWKGNSLVLSNGLVERELVIDNGGIRTKKLKLKGSDLNFNSENSKEFSLFIDGKYCDGQSGWNLISFVSASDIRHGNGATVKLKGTNSFSGIEVDITYLLYPDLPVIRKQITVLNNSGKEIMIESFDIEKLLLGFSFIESVTYTNYGRQKHLSTYVGDWDDPVIAVHSYSRNAGILLGNESPGVLKRTAYNTEYNNVEIGLTHNDENYPFRKYIINNGQWTTPQVFVIPYINSADPWTIMNTSLADFVRRHMGLRINEIKKRPTVMYNNYVPFDDRFNDTLIVSLAKVASECGVKQFEIDCGWHTAQDNIGKKVSWIANTGDWIVDKTKFPNGLKPVFDEIRKAGMEPGLWISVGSAASASKVFKDHPEWAIRDESGKPVNLHSAGDYDLNTMCFGTEWPGYIKRKILDLVHEVGLSFVKLDLTIATSAYITDHKKSGCSAKDHPYHKDREESLIVIYERVFKLFDELHAAAPDLYIDCTFETEGKLQLIDYAFCQHAEGDWLTNIGEPFPVGAFRIRNLTWWKSPALPASAFIIGNLQMDSPEFINELKTLIGSFPIVLGDLRKLSEEKKEEIRQWTDWISSMQKKYNYDLYRQDLPSFGEPTEGAWDAWSRINTDTGSGGIVGIFRQGSLDNQRTVSVPGLNKNKLYRIRYAPSGDELAKMTGKELEEKGFQVKMLQKYDSKLFEIELAD